MFTDKEAKQFLDLLDKEHSEPKSILECNSLTQFFKFIKKLLKKHSNKDIDFLDTCFPNWLPEGIKITVEKRIELVKKYENDKVLELMCDYYGKEIMHIKSLMPLFIEETMKNIWLSLDEISSEKTIKFVADLFHIQSEFQMGLNLYYKHKEEKKCFNKILLKADELKKIMEEYDCHFYGHMLNDEFLELHKSIKNFEEVSKIDFNNFEQETKDITYLFSDLCPITREFQSKTALQVFYIRKLLLNFEDGFEKPFYNYIAEIINLMFDKSYDYNDIIKITKPVKQFLKSENSAPEK